VENFLGGRLAAEGREIYHSRLPLTTLDESELTGFSASHYDLGFLRV
jgi:hypothetical protein